MMPSSFPSPMRFRRAWVLSSNGCPEARRREPHLRPGIPAAVLSEQDHQVENRLLGRALADAARRAGVVLHEHCPVRELSLAAGRACGVVTDGGCDRADAVVLAAGA